MMRKMEEEGQIHQKHLYTLGALSEVVENDKKDIEDALDVTIYRFIEKKKTTPAKSLAILPRVSHKMQLFWICIGSGALMGRSNCPRQVASCTHHSCSNCARHSR